MGQPRPLFSVFSVFSNKHQYNFTTNQCEKMSCPTSRWCRDSNPGPSEHEPPPKTTRPVVVKLGKASFTRVAGRSNCRRGLGGVTNNCKNFKLFATQLSVAGCSKKARWKSL